MSTDTEGDNGHFSAQFDGQSSKQQQQHSKFTHPHFPVLLFVV